MDKTKQNNLVELFEKWAGEQHKSFSAMPPSGSYREYYRIKSENKNAIAVFNADRKENIAFLSFSKHFKSKSLPVPEIFAENLDCDVYLEEDFGDTTLFSYLSQVRKENEFPDELKEIYKKVIAQLPRFQIEAARDLDYSVCYPRASFDKQSMMWDLNYFKYYFLKLAQISFEEQALENDFQTFTEFLLQADTDNFLYRDFQSRNVMLVDGEPKFIDYQGGRKGALHYDIASLLYDSKADIPQPVRIELLDFYLSILKNYIDFDDEEFREYYYGYVLIRIMQAMGAYGFRGFYEKKEHFLKSIPFALKNLEWLLDNVSFPVEIPALLDILAKMTKSERLLEMNGVKIQDKLNVTITSFSYKKGIPKDDSGNGGGFVFDCRAINNPGRYTEYKLLTGQDPEVKKFLEENSCVNDFLNSVYQIIDSSVEAYIDRKFNNLMVNFGCTGGQHRSVYCAEQLSDHLNKKYNVSVNLVHTELNKRN